MTGDRFTVLMTCGVFDPGFRGGGKARAIVQTVDSVSEEVDLTMVTRDRDLGSRRPYPRVSGRWIARGRAQVFYADTGNPRHWLRMWRVLRQRHFDLLYVNSLWDPWFAVVPVLAARLGLVRVRRILMAPHGELQPGALTFNGPKKRIFLPFWKRVLKRIDLTWHATTEREASEVAAVLPWARIFVHHLQVPLAEAPLAPATLGHGPARLVYVGRVTAKKNLDVVLEALQYVSLPVELHIYGPLEETGFWARCQSIIRRLPANVTVRYEGEIPHYPGEPDPARDVRRTFSRYDAFVFPTRSENFGYIVAESLSACCPVICSDTTPWNDVIRDGGGLIIDGLTAPALAKEIDRVAAMTPEERLHARGRAGEAYRRWRRGISNENILDYVRRDGVLPDHP